MYILTNTWTKTTDTWLGPLQVKLQPFVSGIERVGAPPGTVDRQSHRAAACRLTVSLFSVVSVAWHWHSYRTLSSLECSILFQSRCLLVGWELLYCYVPSYPTFNASLYLTGEFCAVGSTIRYGYGVVVVPDREVESYETRVGEKEIRRLCRRCAASVFGACKNSNEIFTL